MDTSQKNIIKFDCFLTIGIQPQGHILQCQTQKISATVKNSGEKPTYSQGYCLEPWRNQTNVWQELRSRQAILLLFTVNRIVIQTGIILVYGLFLRTETLLADGFELFTSSDISSQWQKHNERKFHFEALI